MLCFLMVINGSTETNKEIKQIEADQKAKSQTESTMKPVPV